MKNLTLTKIIQIVSLLAGIAIMTTPIMALAQFTVPNSGGTGLANTFGGASTVSQLILTIINIILALAGLIAVLVLIVGGFRYVTSFGNEEQVGAAKKMIINAIIGIVIIILSFVIVRVVSNFALRPTNV